MSEPVNTSRRRTLIAATAVPGVVTGAAVVTPFVASLAPSERAKAAGAPVTVDLSKLKPGEKAAVEWRGKVVWVLKRTPEQVAALEKIPASLAERVAKELTIPVIGIGAGGKVDGQVLVVQDMLGMSKGFSPRFLRRYADLHTIMTDAIQQYVTDVKDSDFPNEKEQY